MKAASDYQFQQNELTAYIQTAGVWDVTLFVQAQRKRYCARTYNRRRQFSFSRQVTLCDVEHNFYDKAKIKSALSLATVNKNVSWYKFEAKKV